jgi:hypothetical protein
MFRFIVRFFFASAERCGCTSKCKCVSTKMRRPLYKCFGSLHKCFWLLQKDVAALQNVNVLPQKWEDLCTNVLGHCTNVLGHCTSKCKCVSGEYKADCVKVPGNRTRSPVSLPTTYTMWSIFFLLNHCCPGKNSITV